MTLDTITNLALLLCAGVVVAHFTVLSAAVYRLAKQIQQLDFTVARLQEECDAAWGPVEHVRTSPYRVIQVRRQVRFTDRGGNN